MRLSRNFCLDDCLKTVGLTSLSNVDQWEESSVCVDHPNRGPLKKKKEKKEKCCSLSTADIVRAIGKTKSANNYNDSPTKLINIQLGLTNRNLSWAYHNSAQAPYFKSPWQEVLCLLLPPYTFLLLHCFNEDQGQKNSKMCKNWFFTVRF